MPVDDRTRLDLHRKLEAELGPEEANTLMAHLPPVTWNEVATKGDVTSLATTVRGDMETLGTTLRGEMQVMATTVRGEMQVMATTLRSEMHVGFADLRTEIADGITRQIKWMVTFAAAWSSLLVAAVRLIP
jgi:hypothetical protein